MLLSLGKLPKQEGGLRKNYSAFSHPTLQAPKPIRRQRTGAQVIQFGGNQPFPRTRPRKCGERRRGRPAVTKVNRWKPAKRTPMYMTESRDPKWVRERS